MNKLLKDLYDCFYTPPELAATKREIEECHRALIEALGKPERRLVLQIIDAKDQGSYFGGHFARQLHLRISAGVAAVRRIESL